MITWACRTVWLTVLATVMLAPARPPDATIGETVRRDRGRDDEGASGDRPRRATRSGWCREQGLYPAELDAWKQDAIAGLGEPRAASAAEARQDRRRVKELERELHRKDKALAETAAARTFSCLYR